MVRGPGVQTMAHLDQPGYNREQVEIYMENIQAYGQGAKLPGSLLTAVIKL